MNWTNYLELVGLGLIMVIIYTVGYCIYNIAFHPLRNFPGPKLWAASFVPSTREALSGRLPFAIKDLHDEYGEVVRVGPNTLSFDSAQAWEDIYGHLKGEKKKTFEKDYEFYGPTVSGAANIIMAKEDDHRRFRKLQSHAFSEKALKAQESYLQRYTRSFIDRLHDQVKGTSKGLVPMSMWYNFTTFDLIGDLAFAHSFGMTENAELHPWVKITFDYIKMMEFMRLTRIFPSVEKVLHYFIPQSLKDVRTNHAKWSAEKAQARVQMNTDRQDFMSYLLKGDDKNGLTKDEINEAATILILAGSETTATVLTGVTYFLLNRPETYERLKTEIRGSFTSDKEMDLSSLAQQNYLNACLEEGLRMYPPAPTAMPRRSPTGGGVVCGEVIPENAVVGVTSWAAHRSARNWLYPDDFMPERWLGDPRFAGDSQKASQAFSYGPRNCIGKNLAFAEMRLILANLIWNFDLELPQEEKDWFARNKIFILWEKPELHIKLSSRLV